MKWLFKIIALSALVLFCFSAVALALLTDLQKQAITNFTDDFIYETTSRHIICYGGGDYLKVGNYLVLDCTAFAATIIQPARQQVCSDKRISDFPEEILI
ncbi:MAG: hypothetical protein J5922_04415 [Clostridia bacterium]|nr:hypothetical protein [Clostridia bacterium]